MPTNTAFALLLGFLLLVVVAVTGYGALDPLRRGAVDAAAINLARLLAGAIAARVHPAHVGVLAVTAGRHRPPADDWWVRLGPWPARQTPADDRDNTWGRRG